MMWVLIYIISDEIGCGYNIVGEYCNNHIDNQYDINTNRYSKYFKVLRFDYIGKPYYTFINPYSDVQGTILMDDFDRCKHEIHT